MHEIKLLFTQEEMIEFLENLQHKKYDIYIEKRKFIRENSAQIDEEYEEPVPIVYYYRDEILCFEENNYQRKKQILIDEFTKRFREKLLNS